ncbi:MAG TPA: lysophospholipid acyltransferase family protein [Myxococcales bacterium]|nr:lysophospholipid acyltransferase family protein [Myxococcales bacterium]
MRRVWVRMGEWLGGLAWILGVRRAIALDGLKRAFPHLGEGERRRIGRASYRQLGRSLFEILLPLEDAEVEDLVRFENWDLIERAPRGHGAVFAVAHFGNFELLARAAARRGLKLTIIVRTLGDAFGRWLFRTRVRTGIRNLPDRGSGKEALAALRRNEVLALAVDQNMRPSRGIFVDFFGDKACTTPAPAVFALRTGAPLLAVFPIRQPDGRHLVVMRGPFTSTLSGHAAVQDLTQQITRAVEDEVRARPDHWFWVHRRWKTRPE